MWICKLCKRTFKRISGSHLQTHGLSAYEYWALFTSDTGKVKCQICGKFVKRITNSHLRKHNMIMSEYKAAFPSVSTVSKNSHDKMSRTMKGNKNSVGDSSHFRILNRTSNLSPEIRRKRGKSISITLQRKVREEPGYYESLVELALRNSRKTNGGKNVSYHGNFFRSKPEVLVAEALDKLGFEWTYESARLKRSDGKIYIPDFYLKCMDVYLEVKDPCDHHFYSREEALKKISLVDEEVIIVEVNAYFDRFWPKVVDIIMRALSNAGYNVVSNDKRDMLKNSIAVATSSQASLKEDEGSETSQSSLTSKEYDEMATSAQPLDSQGDDIVRPASKDAEAEIKSSVIT